MCAHGSLKGGEGEFSAGAINSLSAPFGGLPCAHIYLQIGYNFVFYFKDFRPILSWPGLSRPPTSGRDTELDGRRRLLDVDPRDKPGDDAVLIVARLHLFGNLPLETIH